MYVYACAVYLFEYFMWQMQSYVLCMCVQNIWSIRRRKYSLWEWQMHIGVHFLCVCVCLRVCVCVWSIWWMLPFPVKKGESICTYILLSICVSMHTFCLWVCKRECVCACMCPCLCSCGRICVYVLWKRVRAHQCTSVSERMRIHTRTHIRTCMYKCISTYRERKWLYMCVHTHILTHSCLYT